MSNLELSSAATQIENQMHDLMDRLLPRRKPVSLEDYDWSQVNDRGLNQDFIEALGFVTLVEANPEAPAGKILAAADRSKSSWLRRFITETWLPEERMHHVPYKEYLMRTGAYDKRFLDKEISNVIARGFIHGEEYTELQATTYGWLQELITWKFYDSMRSYALSQNPEDALIAKILGDVAKQENFHRYIYLSGAKTILAHSPERKGEVIEAVANFLMPGHHMAPHWQHKAPTWANTFRFPIRGLLHDMVSGLRDLTGYNGLGQASILYGAQNTIHWYFKPIITVVAPLARKYNSPINYLSGRLIAQFF